MCNAHAHARDGSYHPRPERSFGDMFKTLREQSFHVPVAEGIVHDLAPFSLFHQACPIQGRELVGYGRVLHAQEGGNIADAHFGNGEGVEDLQARGIAEDLEEPAQLGDMILFVRHGFADSVNDFSMDNLTRMRRFFLHYLNICSYEQIVKSKWQQRITPERI